MIRALVVDDEQDARSVLTKMIELFCPGIAEVETAANRVEALTAVRERPFHLVFLDIQLGNSSGLDLATEINPFCSNIIFVTAYENYAVRAFQKGALHYLVKPIDPDGLTEAVNRAGLTEQSVRKEAKIYLTTKDEVRVLRQSEICYLKGEGNYTSFHVHPDEELFVSRHLAYYREQLDAAKFLQTHQTYLVNVDFITTLKKNGQSVVLKNGAEIPVSRRNRDAVRQFFQ